MGRDGLLIQPSVDCNLIGMKVKVDPLVIESDLLAGRIVPLILRTDWSELCDQSPSKQNKNKNKKQQPPCIIRIDAHRHPPTPTDAPRRPLIPSSVDSFRSGSGASLLFAAVDSSVLFNVSVAPSLGSVGSFRIFGGFLEIL